MSKAPGSKPFLPACQEHAGLRVLVAYKDVREAVKDVRPENSGNLSSSMIAINLLSSVVPLCLSDIQELCGLTRLFTWMLVWGRL